MFWNGTTCQKRKISDGKRTQNDNRAPVSDAVRSSLTGTGAFLFCFSGEARRSNDAGIRHNHRAQALVFRGFGAEPTNKLFAIRPGLHCLLLFTIMSDKMDLTSDLSFTIISDRRVTQLDAEVTMAKDTKERILMATGQVRHLQAL